MKRVLLTTLLVLLLSLLITGVAYEQDGDTQNGTGATVEVAVLLAPLIAAATAVERLIEMIFEWYESTILDLSKFPAQASDYLAWARKEVEKHKNILIKPKQDSESEADFFARLRKAEEDLHKAQDRLQEYITSPTYISQKKKFSLIIGIVLGLVVALSAQIKMFSLLGIPMPENLALVDMIITGLVIGTGSAPVHSLIGLIQNTKNAVDGARALWQGKATVDVQRILLDMQAQQAASMSAPAPLAGMAGIPEGKAPEAAPAAPEMSALELDRMAKRILRK